MHAVGTGPLELQMLYSELITSSPFDHTLNARRGYIPYGWARADNKMNIGNVIRQGLKHSTRRISTTDLGEGLRHYDEVLWSRRLDLITVEVLWSYTDLAGSLFWPETREVKR